MEMIDTRTPVVLTPAETAAQGFPHVGLRFDASQLGLICFRFPEAPYFIRMSGPPGGPCRVDIEWIPETPRGLPDPESLARRLDKPGSKFALGTAGKIECAGAARPAISWRMQPTPWVEQSTGILIALPAHHGAIWIMIPGEGGLTGPPRVSQHYAKITRSFELIAK